MRVTKFLCAFFLIVASISLKGQAKDTSHALVIERLSSGRVDTSYGFFVVPVGSTIMVRTVIDLHPQQGTLTRVTDTTIVLDNKTPIYIRQLTEVTWETPPTAINKQKTPALIVGGMIAGVGGLLLLRFGHVRSLGGLYLGIGATLTGIFMIAKGIEGGSGKNGSKKQKRQFGPHWIPASVSVECAKRHERKSN